MASLNAARSALGRRGKVALHRALLACNLDLVRHPPARRLVRLLDAARTRLVLDIGANTGQFAHQLRAAGYRGDIVSFEPLADAFAELHRASERDERWTARQLALGATPRTMRIHRAGNSYSSSLLPMMRLHEAVAPNSRVVGFEAVTVATLDDVLDEAGLDATGALLKIDTQGYESDVLRGAQHALETCAIVKVELSLVELYEGQAGYLDVLAQLTARNFVLGGVEPGFTDERTGQMLQFDGVFLRGELSERLLAQARAR